MIKNVVTDDVFTVCGTLGDAYIICYYGDKMAVTLGTVWKMLYNKEQSAPIDSLS